MMPLTLEEHKLSIFPTSLLKCFYSNNNSTKKMVKFESILYNPNGSFSSGGEYVIKCIDHTDIHEYDSLEVHIIIFILNHTS